MAGQVPRPNEWNGCLESGETLVRYYGRRLESYGEKAKSLGFKVQLVGRQEDKLGIEL